MPGLTGSLVSDDRESVETPYSDKTFGDPNPLKRYLQSKRLEHAIDLVSELLTPKCIVDFGAGNGELSKRLVRRFPEARVFCFEPHPGLLEQAREHLAGITNIVFAGSFEELPVHEVDQLYCLEVFEHLPTRELEQALSRIEQLLEPHGHLVVGIPIEIGPPALLKGLFRMVRRYGEFDANWSNVLSCATGRPPANRPLVELMPGVEYHLHHLGFDHRDLRVRLQRDFDEVRGSTSPLPVGGTWLNMELNLLLRKRERQS